MDAKFVIRRVVRAEEDLAAAQARLHAEQRAAVFGTGQPEALDAALLAYREAQANVAAARAALAELRAAGDLGAPAESAGSAAAERVDDVPSPPEPPSPRLLFARWLVETGRLSDWMAA
jgi:hypothetical protein